MLTTLMDAGHHFENLPWIARRNRVINTTGEEDMPRNFLLDVVLFKITSKLITNKLRKMVIGLTSVGLSCTDLKVKSPASPFL